MMMNLESFRHKHINKKIKKN